MEIRPIRTETDYEAVLAEIEDLLDAEEGSLEEDRLEVLSILAEAWEDRHHPIDPPDPIAAIEFRMEQQGLSRKDLEVYLGRRQRVADVLNRKRPLSLPMIRRLHEGLGIPAEVLIRETSDRPCGSIEHGRRSDMDSKLGQVTVKGDLTAPTEEEWENA